MGVLYLRAMDMTVSTKAINDLCVRVRAEQVRVTRHHKRIDGCGDLGFLECQSCQEGFCLPCAVRTEGKPAFAIVNEALAFVLEHQSCRHDNMEEVGS